MKFYERWLQALPFSSPPPAVASPLACLSRVYFSRYPPNGELARRLAISVFQHQHIRDLTIQQHFSLSPPRLAFLAWGDLTRARVSLALLSLRKNGDYSSLLYVWQNLLPRVKNPGGKKTNGNVLLTCVLSGANTLKSSS